MQYLTQHSTSDVMGLIEKVARTWPGKPALVYPDKTLTYQELMSEAQALAEQLLSAGVQPEEPIGLHQPAGGTVIVMMLGILMAGGCVVYLEPSYPAARLRELTDMAGVKRVLSGQARIWNAINSDIEILTWHDPVSFMPKVSVPRPQIFPNQLATIIFTSGSTGRPKAVAIEHQHLVRLATESIAGYLPENERVGQAATFAFDASLIEIWPCLLQGQTLVGMEKQDVIQARRLREVLLQKGITSLFLTTSLFNSIVEQDPRTFNSLRSVRFGGEAGSLSACRRIFEAGFTGELFNLYGPTETTVYVTAHAVKPADTVRMTMPLGRAADQATVSSFG
jgi:non-ribosomal peptide synthetase component F